MRGCPTNFRIFMVFYPRAGAILARGSKVVYLRNVDEWLSWVPEVGAILPFLGSGSEASSK